MASGTFVPTGKAFELALYLIRIYRSLDAIVGARPQDHARVDGSPEHRRARGCLGNWS